MPLKEGRRGFRTCITDKEFNGHFCLTDVFIHGPLKTFARNSRNDADVNKKNCQMQSAVSIVVNFPPENRKINFMENY